MLQLLSALLDNPSLYIAPYVASLVPSVLTCLIGKRLGASPPDHPTAHYSLRDLAASLLSTIVSRYGDQSSTLKPRITRSCLKAFLDSHKPFGSHYGAIKGLQVVADTAGIRALVLPNLKAYDAILKQGLADETTKEQAERVVLLLLEALRSLDPVSGSASNGHPEGDQLKGRLEGAVGDVLGGRVFDTQSQALVAAVLEADLE